MRLNLNRNRAIIGAATVAMVLGGAVGYQRWKAYQAWQTFQDKLAQADMVMDIEAINVDIKDSKYELVAGWNFISFPATPLSAKTAKGLLMDISQSGGYATMISRWNGDRWEEFSYRGNQSYGFDFPLIAGEAYFVLSHKAFTWNVALENEAVDSSAKSIALKTGWNAVGVSPSMANDARGIMDRLQQNGRERAVEVDRWYSGNWDVFVKRIYSSSNIQEYGNNFTVEPTRGYMIKALENTTLTQGGK